MRWHLWIRGHELCLIGIFVGLQSSHSLPQKLCVEVTLKQREPRLYYTKPSDLVTDRQSTLTSSEWWTDSEICYGCISHQHPFHFAAVEDADRAAFNSTICYHPRPLHPGLFCEQFDTVSYFFHLHTFTAIIVFFFFVEAIIITDMIFSDESY